MKKIHLPQFVMALLTAAGLMLLPAAAMAQTASANTPPSLTASQKSDLRLALDKVQLDIDSGKLDDATALVEDLKKKYPDNPDVLAAENDIKNQGESNEVAISDLCQAKNLDPAVAGIMDRDSNTSMPSRGTYGCAGYNRRITKEAFEQLSNISGQTIVAPNTSLALDLDNDHINTRMPFTRANGTTQSFYGDRQQGTATLDRMFGSNNEVAASIYAVDDNAGGGLQYRRWDPWGSTSIKADVNRPNWDYVEMAVENGTVDSVIVERQQIILKDLTASIDGAFRRYSVDEDGNAADAPGWNFNLDYDHDFNFSGSKDPIYDVTLGAHYDLDAEYFTHVDSRISTAHFFYAPLPAATYENHSFTFSADKSFLSDMIKIDGFGGYGVNRIAGNSGPLYGASLTYSPIQHLGIDIHGSRNLLGGQNESEKEDILGASLKWMW